MIGRILAALGLSAAMLLGLAGPASAEDFVFYQRGAVKRECTLSEYWQVGAVPGVDTCVVEPMGRNRF